MHFLCIKRQCHKVCVAVIFNLSLLRVNEEDPTSAIHPSRCPLRNIHTQLCNSTAAVLWSIPITILADFHSSKTKNLRHNTYLVQTCKISAPTSKIESRTLARRLGHIRKSYPECLQYPSQYPNKSQNSASKQAACISLCTISCSLQTTGGTQILPKGDSTRVYVIPSSFALYWNVVCHRFTVPCHVNIRCDNKVDSDDGGNGGVTLLSLPG